jgi:hypothetical protein
MGHQGVGIRGGAEAMCRAVQMFSGLLAPETDLTTLKVDVKNAFNSISPREDAQSLPDDQGVADDLLALRRSTLTTDLIFAEGAFGPLFFAVAFPVAVQRAQDLDLSS